MKVTSWADEEMELKTRIIQKLDEREAFWRVLFARRIRRYFHACSKASRHIWNIFMKFFKAKIWRKIWLIHIKWRPVRSLSQTVRQDESRSQQKQKYFKQIFLFWEDTVLPDEDETSKSFAILDFIFNLIQNKSRWQKKNVYAMGN